MTTIVKVNGHQELLANGRRVALNRLRDLARDNNANAYVADWLHQFLVNTSYSHEVGDVSHDIDLAREYAYRAYSRLAGINPDTHAPASSAPAADPTAESKRWHSPANLPPPTLEDTLAEIDFGVLDSHAPTKFPPKPKEAKKPAQKKPNPTIIYW
uniref:Uncharacterized protein n=1 Tax=viral metagenome TaxID=1070528 RepID=A0A6H2A406_9ZZZZ